jgi:hypothetical protein
MRFNTEIYIYVYQRERDPREEERAGKLNLVVFFVQRTKVFEILSILSNRTLLVQYISEVRDRGSSYEVSKDEGVRSVLKQQNDSIYHLSN